MTPATRVAILLATVALACGGPGDEPPRGAVVVVVDTLRADHLGAYGYARDTSPRRPPWNRRSPATLPILAYAALRHSSDDAHQTTN